VSFRNPLLGSVAPGLVLYLRIWRKSRSGGERWCGKHGDGLIAFV
jgi:hypothetical protein